MYTSLFKLHLSVTSTVEANISHCLKTLWVDSYFKYDYLHLHRGLLSNLVIQNINKCSFNQLIHAAFSKQQRESMFHMGLEPQLCGLKCFLIHLSITTSSSCWLLTVLNKAGQYKDISLLRYETIICLKYWIWFWRLHYSKLM